MRVVIVASGLSYHASRWANSLADAGLRIAYATHHREVTRPLRDDIEVLSVGRGRKSDYLVGSVALRRFCRRWNASLLHSHYATGCGWLGKLSGFSPRIVSVYGADIFDFPRKGLLHRRVLRFALDGADAVLSTSAVMADRLVGEFPDMQRPVVTPFGVDIDRFKPSEPVTHSATFNIGLVKRLEVKYGVDVLIRGVALFREEHPTTTMQLNIAGAGSQSDALRGLSDRLGLQDCVKFVGLIDNHRVPEFLQKQDVFVVPSRYDSESFGVAAVEAQACGLPVIASRVGGLPEVVDDGVTGIIIPKEDPAALAGALTQMFQDPEMRRRMGRAGRERVKRNYDWNSNVQQMMAIYSDVARA